MACNCAKCGAALTVNPDCRTQSCPQCKTVLFTAGRLGIPHYYFPVTVKHAVLGDALNSWLKDHELLYLPHLKKSRLVYFPFWRLVSGSRSLFAPAALSSYPEIGDLGFPAGEYKSYAAEMEDVFEIIPPDVNPKSLLPLLGVVTDETPTLTLFHIPLYLVSYRYRRGLHEAVIDGVEGRTAAAYRPSSMELSLDTNFSLALAGATLVFAAEFYIFPGFWIPLGLSLLSALPLYLGYEHWLLRHKEK